MNPTEVALFEVLEVNGAAGDPMLINSLSTASHGSKNGRIPFVDRRGGLTERDTCEREARRWSERSLARPLTLRPEKGPATADLRRWSQRQLSQLQAGLAAERRAAASSATTAATLDSSAF